MRYGIPKTRYGNGIKNYHTEFPIYRNIRYGIRYDTQCTVYRTESPLLVPSQSEIIFVGGGSNEFAVNLATIEKIKLLILL